MIASQVIVYDMGTRSEDVSLDLAMIQIYERTDCSSKLAMTTLVGTSCGVNFFKSRIDEVVSSRRTQDG